MRSGPAAALFLPLAASAIGSPGTLAGPQPGLAEYSRQSDVIYGRKFGVALTMEIPTDPFTNSADSWRTIPAKGNPNNSAAAPGIYDIRSGSEATTLDGTKYSDW